LVIASAITAFGAAGLISMTGFGLNSLMSTIVALGFSGAIGAALFYGVVKFMYGSQSNSVFSLDALIGLEAEVITPLPEKGLGEIAYKAHGMRSTITARSLDGTEIRRGADVIIREISGNVAVVQRKLTLDDIILDDVTEDSQEDWRNREAKGPGDAGEAEGSWDEGEAEGSWDAGNEESFGNAGDTMGSWDAGDIEEADNGKPRRNAGNINN
jgi:membrane protein implicated in regulation of membrane protease activity